jgi:MFS family permease
MRSGLISRPGDFRRLWIGNAVSQVGTQVSMLAVPLLAVLTLHASTFQVGVLTAAENAAFLLIGLPAGAWVDRLRRRPVLIAGDLLRAALLASLPLAAALGVLTLGQLYAVVFAVGTGTVFFEVAHQSYLPSLVGREHLVEANSRLEANRSVAYAVGPTVAGYLVQALTAPFALLVDAASFAWSACWIVAIRHREPRPVAAAHRSLRREIMAGLRQVFGHPVLRATAVYGSCTVLFMALARAVEVVFLVRSVHLAPAGIGLLYSLSSLGAVAGALVGAPLGRRLGPSRTMLWSALVAHLFMLLIPLTGPGLRLAYYAVGVAVSSLCIVVFNIVSVSYRQTLCPDHLLGRMNATMRFMIWGALPVGGLIGGALGTALGLRPTLWVSALGGLLAVAWLVWSPLRQTREAAQPEPVGTVAR